MMGILKLLARSASWWFSLHHGHGHGVLFKDQNKTGGEDFWTGSNLEGRGS
jgi:hypothetical protein